MTRTSVVVLKRQKPSLRGLLRRAEADRTERDEII